MMQILKKNWEGKKGVKPNSCRGFQPGGDLKHN